MSQRLSRRLTVAAVLAAVVTACTVPVSQAAPSLDASIQIPWDQVGDGWTLATWNPVPGHRMGETPPPDQQAPKDAPVTLYLIDPAGRRYAITTFGPESRKSGLYLRDWSGDGSRALFTTGDTVVVVDLHTGSQTSFPFKGSARFSRPNGQAIVLAQPSTRDRSGTLQRVDLDGNAQLTYPTEQLGGAGSFGGGYLETRDGTALVLATDNPRTDRNQDVDNSFVMMGNDGTVGRVIPAPMHDASCRLTRWATAKDFLASCTLVKGAVGSQLWQIPIDGSAPTAVTALNNGKGEPGFDGDYGDTDGWKLPSGTFVQSLGACGVVFLSRVTADGHTEKVKVPGAGDNISVVGASGDKLLLKSTTGCSPSTALMTYDPQANATKVLLGPTVNDGRVVDALTFGEGYLS